MNQTKTTPFEVSAEQRELLKKMFQHQGPDKALSKEEYTKIRDLLDKQRGGLKKEAYEAVKADKDLVKGALIDQIKRDHRIMEAKAPDVRDTLLKALQAAPEEKPLSKDEFKTVAIFLDRQNGGLRRHAYQLFKEDKEIVGASKLQRDRWKPKEAKQELTTDVKDAVDVMNKKVRSKSVKVTKANELEPGD